MATLPGLGKSEKKQHEKSIHPSTPLDQLTEKEKLQYLALKYRTEERFARQRRHQTWYMMALYFQGYQNVEFNAGTGSLDVFEDEDSFTENQFRKDVMHTVNSLMKLEGEITSRPGSSSPEDIAASRVAENILPIIHENIDYDRLKVVKSLYKCLFGTAFVFVDYATDRAFGMISRPRYEYEDVELGPTSQCPVCGYSEELNEEEPFCPECMAPMELGAPISIPTKVEAGMEEFPAGREIAVVCSPLEIIVPSSVSGGLPKSPYLIWTCREDTGLVNGIYSGLNAGSDTSKTENDLAAQYLDILSGLPGNILGDSTTYTSGAEDHERSEVIRAWLRPQTFMGDKKLIEKYPDGVFVALVNGQIVEYRPESMDDHWTSEAYTPNPHSFYADGMYDAIPIQDQINEMDRLIIQHTRYSTVSHKIYDANRIDIKNVVNNPAQGWIPANGTMEHGIDGVVRDLAPNQLSADVAAWRSALLGAMRDVNATHEAVTGEEIGANTAYSTYVHQAESALGRHAPSAKYNAKQVITFHKQLFKIVKENWIDERKTWVEQNNGQWSYSKFVGSDLGQGSFDIRLSNTDMIPKTRAEQLHALGFYATIQPLLATLSPRQVVYIEDVIGLPPGSNPVSSQISRAHRVIDRIVNGEMLSPTPIVDNADIQVPAFTEYLSGEDGEELQKTNPEGYQAVSEYMMTLLQMGMMQASTIGPVGGQPQPQNAPQGAPPPKGPTQRMAQSPVAADQQQPMPPLPNDGQGVM
jgi:hypothetical protein